MPRRPLRGGSRSFSLLGAGDRPVGVPGGVTEQGEDDDQPEEPGDDAQREQGEDDRAPRSEEHTSELQSLMRISYAVFCLKKKIQQNTLTEHRRNIDDTTQHKTQQPHIQTRTSKHTK